MTRLPTEQCAAFIGIDWADAQHAICLPAAGSEQRACRVRDHQPDTSNAGGSPWRTRFQGQPRALCLERHKGPLVSARRQPDVLVLFPVKPLTLARYREACTPSQAQDDPTDAALQLALWLKPRAKLKPLQPQSPPRRALAQLVASRRRLVGDQVRLTHRLPSTLTNSFPHALPWCHDKDTTSFWDVLTPWPTRKAVPLARRSSLERCFREPHVRDPAVINQRIDAIQSAPPRTTAAGVLTPHVLLVQALVPPRRATLHTIAAFDQAIAPRAQSPPAFPFFDTLPGAGAVLAPRLLVAFGAQRDRYASADALQKYAGLAPVTARRGNKAWGHWRLQCPPCLRQTCVAWAAASTRHACWARAYDQQPRDQGASHQAAVRALAFTWLRMLFRCWQNRTPYHASVYLNALERRGSPLLTQRHQGSEKIVHDP